MVDSKPVICVACTVWCLYWYPLLSRIDTLNKKISKIYRKARCSSDSLPLNSKKGIFKCIHFAIILTSYMCIISPISFSDTSYWGNWPFVNEKITM